MQAPLVGVIKYQNQKCKTLSSILACSLFLTHVLYLIKEHFVQRGGSTEAGSTGCRNSSFCAYLCHVGRNIITGKMQAKEWQCNEQRSAHYELFCCAQFFTKKDPKQHKYSEFISLMNLCSFGVFKANKTEKNNLMPFLK